MYLKKKLIFIFDEVKMSFFNKKDVLFNLFLFFGLCVLYLFFFAEIASMEGAKVLKTVEAVESPEEINVFKKHLLDHGATYLKVGGVVLFICLMYGSFFRGGGGDSGTVDFKAVHWGSDSDISNDSSEVGTNLVELLDPTIEEVLPVAATAAAAMVSLSVGQEPAVEETLSASNIVVDTGMTLFCLTPEFYSCIESNLMVLQGVVSSTLEESVRINGVSYFTNFVDVLRQRDVRDLIGYLTGRGSDILDLMRGIIRSDEELVSSSIMYYSQSISVNFLELAKSAILSVLGENMLTDTVLNILTGLLTCIALTWFRYPNVVECLIQGNSYDVIASITFETIHWCFVNSLVEKYGEKGGVNCFIKLLNGDNNLPVASYLVTGVEMFANVLKERCNSSVEIKVNDTYILVMALSKVLKSFVENKFYSSS